MKSNTRTIPHAGPVVSRLSLTYDAFFCRLKPARYDPPPSNSRATPCRAAQVPQTFLNFRFRACKLPFYSCFSAVAFSFPVLPPSFSSCPCAAMSVPRPFPGSPRPGLRPQLAFELALSSQRPPFQIKPKNPFNLSIPVGRHYECLRTLHSRACCFSCPREIFLLSHAAAPQYWRPHPGRFDSFPRGLYNETSLAMSMKRQLMRVMTGTCCLMILLPAVHAALACALLLPVLVRVCGRCRRTPDLAAPSVPVLSMCSCCVQKLLVGP